MMKNAPKFSFQAPEMAVKKMLSMIVFALSFVLSTNMADAAKRVALVIGNSAYEHAAPLKNPRNDAEDISAKLRSLGFEVVSGLDLDSRGMRDKVREFGDKLRDADVAMFYYAGHALQVNGRNFLAPVNTDIRHEGDLDFETIPMDFVQRQMERETKTVLLFLDACRDNPLARNLRKSSRSTGGTRGLARETNSSEGTFIAFSTQPNNVALDGDGRNSPFTTALLNNIGRSGVEISTLMTDVRRQVFEETKEAQIPWINSSLLGRFYFAGSESDNVDPSKQVASLDAKTITPEVVTPTVTKTPITKSVSTPTNDTDKLLSMRLEQLAWEAVKDSKDVDELNAYISSYGNGFFGNLAKLRLAKIEKKNSTEVASLEKKTEVARKIEVEKVLRDEPAATPKIITREVTLQIQRELNRVGCVAGRPDGLWGKKSVRATSLFSKHAKIRLASYQPSHDLLKELRAHNRRICPAPRVRKQAPVVKKQAPRVKKQQVRTCKSGQLVSRKGNCYWPKKKVVKKSCKAGQRISRKGNCYWPKQPQRVVQQPQPRRVIVQQPRRVVVQPQPQQPRRKSGLLGGAVAGAIGGAIVNCALGNC